MNQKIFRRSMVIVLCVTFVLGLTYLQAQTPGKIPKFLDPAGTLGDSVAKYTLA